MGGAGRRGDRGAAATEYGLLITLISVAIAAGVASFGAGLFPDPCTLFPTICADTGSNGAAPGGGEDPGTVPNGRPAPTSSSSPTETPAPTSTPTDTPTPSTTDTPGGTPRPSSTADPCRSPDPASVPTDCSPPSPTGTAAAAP